LLKSLFLSLKESFIFTKLMFLITMMIWFSAPHPLNWTRMQRTVRLALAAAFLLSRAPQMQMQQHQQWQK